MLAADPAEAGRRAAGEARASLGDRPPSFAVLYTKSYFGTPAEESLIQRILHSCDFAVAAIGD